MHLNHFNILSEHKSLCNLLINRIYIENELPYAEVFLNINNEIIQARSSNNIHELQPYL